MTAADDCCAYVPVPLYRRAAVEARCPAAEARAADQLIHADADSMHMRASLVQPRVQSPDGGSCKNCADASAHHRAISGRPIQTIMRDPLHELEGLKWQLRHRPPSIAADAQTVITNDTCMATALLH